jgi:hypothetical protein
LLKLLKRPVTSTKYARFFIQPSFFIQFFKSVLLQK